MFMIAVLDICKLSERTNQLINISANFLYKSAKILLQLQFRYQKEPSRASIRASRRTVSSTLTGDRARLDIKVYLFSPMDVLSISG